MKDLFLKSLSAAATVLSKFAEPTVPGSLKWDGAKYAPATGSPSDIQAAKWWGILTTLAGMLDSQAMPLSAEQKKYIDHLLFSGMGSFNDFALDQNRLGNEAANANGELTCLRAEMYRAFAAGI
jgi:hypothetical protein